MKVATNEPATKALATHTPDGNRSARPQCAQEVVLYQVQSEIEVTACKHSNLTQRAASILTCPRTYRGPPLEAKTFKSCLMSLFAFVVQVLSAQASQLSLEQEHCQIFLSYSDLPARTAGR